jgi:predicted ATPase/DNA-binding SARP family transcriptional activator
VKFGILGPVEAWIEDERLALGGPRQLTLLAFLVLHANRAVSSDMLLDGVWGGANREGGGAKRLSVAIARLRKALEPLCLEGSQVLRTVTGGYMLSLAPGDLDAELFEAMVREGRAALDAGDAARAGERLRTALAMWRGPALADVSFETFAQGEIRRLEELRLSAVEARIDADLQLRADTALVGELEALLQQHPTREQLARQLMLALYRSGRQAEALDVYQRTRAHLTGEFGLEPGPALRALQAQILEQAPTIEPTTDGDRRLLRQLLLPGEPVTMVIAELDNQASLRQQLGHLYQEVVGGVDELLRQVWSRRAGVRVADRGAGLLAVFASPNAALEAALEARDAPAAVEWPGGVKVRLRIGVHTGHLRVSGGGYWGEDIHYAARLAEVAHPGQVLVSGVSAALTPEAALVDLGEHRLNDFAVPARLFGLGPGPHRVPRTGDPLRSNLPRAHGELIGRDSERVELVGALRSGESRLVTITGSGGSGKTRLALAVAESIVDVLADGAFFVPLAQVSDPDAVVAAIAAPLGIQLQAGSEPTEAIGRALSDRNLLLVLDNFEHLLEAAPLVTGLIACAPGLRVMVTSQAPLQVRGERVLALGRLEVPEASDQTSVAAAAAGRLLLERTRERDPGFELTADNAGSVARLCRALGGLPLALELAAARLTLLSPEELLTRLDEGIDALGRGPRDLPARQRGLRAALDWTHGLLDADQARLFRRLGAFAGSVSLERIEQVCGAGTDLLEALAQLVDLSLVTRTDDGRFILHAAVRDYARAKLAAAAESQQLARRHGETFAQAAASWGNRCLFDFVAVQSVVLRDEADIGQALTWAAAADQECFALLAGGVSMPLLFAGRLLPLSEIIEQALARDAVSGSPRTWLLLAASLAAVQRGEIQLAGARLASTVAAAEQAADPRLSCLMRICSFLFRVLTGTTDGVRDDYSQVSERVAKLRDRELALLVEGLEPYVLGYCEQRYAEAGAIWAALAADHARTDFAASSALYCWPDCLLLEGEYEAALETYGAALRGARESGQAPTVAYQLEGIVISLSGLGRHDEALEAAGWAASVRQTAGPALNSWYTEMLQRAQRESRAAIGEQDANAAYARGRALTIDAAVTAGLNVQPAR